MMVPAVTEVCLPQPAHSPGPRLSLQRPRFAAAAAGAHEALGPARREQYFTHAASSPKRCWNSIKEREKSVIFATGGHGVRGFL
jgi:hypothetical protein